MSYDQMMSPAADPVSISSMNGPSFSPSVNPLASRQTTWASFET